MVLKNYWKWLDYMNSHSFYGSADYNNTNTGMIATSGSAASIVTQNNSYFDTVVFNRLLTSGITIRVGTGSDTIAFTDYSLATDVTDSLSNLNTTLNTYIENGYSKVITLTGENNTGNSITITTAAICKKFYRARDITESETCKVLMAKYTLATPLTIENGQGFNVTLNWVES